MKRTNAKFGDASETLVHQIERVGNSSEKVRNPARHYRTDASGVETEREDERRKHQRREKFADFPREKHTDQRHERIENAVARESRAQLAGAVDSEYAAPE